MRRFFQQHYQVIISALIFGLFVALTIFVNNVHEPWRDEAQAWLIARDHPLPWTIFQMSAFEGSPMLLQLLLWPFAQLGLPYVTIHLLHGFVVCAVVALILRFAPFPFWIRCLLPFSYYLAYEYNAIARNYVLAAALLLCLAQLYRERWHRPITYHFCLILLSQVSAHAAILAGVFFLAFVYEGCVVKLWEERESVSRRAGFAALTTGLVLFGTVLQLWPDPELGDAFKTMHIPSIWMILYGLNHHPAALFFPVFIPDIHFWNVSQLSLVTNFLPLGYVLLLFFGWYFWKSSLTLRGIVLFGFVCVETFFSIYYIPSQRHFGVLFFFFLACFWIDLRERTVPLFYRRALFLFLTVVLCVQMSSATVAILQDYRFTFSSAELAAQQIPGTQEDTTLIFFPAYIGVAILPYLEPQYTQFYGLEQHRTMSWVEFDHQMIVNMDLSEANERLQQDLPKFQTAHVIIVAPKGYDAFLESQYEKIWEYTNPTIIATEQFAVYRIR